MEKNMKKLMTATLVCALMAPAVYAGAKCEKECATKCEKGAEKVSVATKAAVPAEGHAKYKVTGMTCGGCEGKVKAALTKLDGVKVDKVCSKSECAEVTYDAAKVKPEQIEAAIKATGFKVEGTQKHFDVSGMTCGGCEGKVKAALTKLDGVQVDKVCHKSGAADVTFDASKVSEEDIAKAINGTGFKVSN